jgi:hypothetical protein
MRKSKFVREADMLAPIVEQKAKLLPGRQVEALFEIQTTAGIPDIVCIEFDESILSRRSESAQRFILNFADMCIMRALNSFNGETVSAATLSRLVPLSAKYISAAVLPRLAECGHAAKESRGLWRAVSRFESLAKYICTVEVKVRDWRSGYSQTLRHRASADESWLVLDSTNSAPASAHREWFTRAGIGLATLHPTEGIKRSVSPSPRERENTVNVYRELLAERAAHLYSIGKVSGSIGLVFGVDLTTTTGPDPRRASAVEHRPSREVAHSTIS